jgi:hypothetical protein
MKLGKALPIGVGVGVAALAGWTLWGAFASRVEEARYDILKKTLGYEIRRYAPRLVAQASVQGAYERALGEGFRIVTGYIFGGNCRRDRIEATPPVGTPPEADSERIAMTAPISVEERPGDTFTVGFTMPQQYTRENLPEPTDNRVRIVAEPERDVAVLRFGWPRSRSRIKAKEEDLLALLARDGIEPAGTPFFAGYNPPGTPPWLVRNEIIVELR